MTGYRKAVLIDRNLILFRPNTYFKFLIREVGNNKQRHSQVTKRQSLKCDHFVVKFFRRKTTNSELIKIVARLDFQL